MPSNWLTICPMSGWCDTKRIVCLLLGQLTSFSTSSGKALGESSSRHLYFRPSGFKVCSARTVGQQSIFELSGNCLSSHRDIRMACRSPRALKGRSLSDCPSINSTASACRQNIKSIATLCKRKSEHATHTCHINDESFSSNIHIKIK